MERLTEVLYRPRVQAQTEPPECLLSHFADDGFDVVFDNRDPAVIVARHALGREPIVADDLPKDVRDELLGSGYKIDPQDGSIVLGDGCFYRQPVELRNQLRAETAAYLARIDDNEPLMDDIEQLNRESFHPRHGQVARVEPRGRIPKLSEQTRTGKELIEMMAALGGRAD